MANWKKLNKEFYNILNAIANKWSKWKNNRAEKRRLKRLELIWKNKIKAQKLHDGNECW